MSRSCSHCKQEIHTGEDIYLIDSLAPGEIFCSEDCGKEWICDHVDDIFNENSYVDEMEEEDPYAKYGVRESDF